MSKASSSGLRPQLEPNAKSWNVNPIDLLRSLAACNPNSKLSSTIRRIKTAEQVIELSINPAHYENPDEFRHDYLCVEFLSKYDNLDLSIDRATVAYDKFKEADLVCKRLNEQGFLDRQYPNWQSCESVIHTARRKIEDLLGDLLTDDDKLDMSIIDEIVGKSRLSGGASYSLKRTLSRPSVKMEPCFIDVTPDCLALLRYFLRGNEPKYRLVEGNKVTTVPKNSKTDRVIAMEPAGNMLVQKGIGAYLKAKLKTRGINIDLKDQTINQELAKIGSIDGSLATIDLKAASDSISIAVCELLLPPMWFELLMHTRSPIGELGDETITYEKISSMGNGYTFELESLLFWAISSACIDVSGSPDLRLSVYGDDIIVPSAEAPFVIDVLGYLGFSTNEKKTFSCGPFRESCGKHYFQGVDVSPFYLQHNRDITDGFVVCNNFKRWINNDPRYKGCLQRFIKGLPVQWRLPRIPEGLGDGALVGTFDEIIHNLDTPTARFLRKNGTCSFVSYVVLPCSKQVLDPYQNGAYRYDLWSRMNIESERSESEKRINPLGYSHYSDVGGLRVAKLAIHEWSI